jgi:hypothetical protein
MTSSTSVLHDGVVYPNRRGDPREGKGAVVCPKPPAGREKTNEFTIVWAAEIHTLAQFKREAIEISEPPLARFNTERLCNLQHQSTERSSKSSWTTTTTFLCTRKRKEVGAGPKP